MHRKSNRCVSFNVQFFHVCASGAIFFPLHGKIAGKTIQFSHLVSWTTVCRMEMIDNVLFSFTWNTISPPTAFFPLFVCVCLCLIIECDVDAIICNNFHLCSCRIHTQYHAKQRIKSRRYMKLIPSNSAKRLHLAHFQWEKWLWAIFASSSSSSSMSCSCMLLLLGGWWMLSEKTNRAANDWMKMQNKFFAHTKQEPNPVASLNCKPTC